MNHDDFLNVLQQPPRPEFSRGLREQLREAAEAEAARRARIRPLATLAVAAAALVAAFAFPAVRASAQAVLDLFRVRNFAAVPFDPSRLERLRAEGGDRAFGVFDQHRVLREPGPARAYASYEAAGAAAGLPLRHPRELASGYALDTLWVSGPGEAELTLEAERLRTVLAALELTDVEVPVGLDGRAIRVSMPPVTTARYAAGRRRFTFIQARSPEVALPSGVDPTALGELGLRVLGLDAAEAHRLAARIDWRNTLIVPVPVEAASFRTVRVQGHEGLLVSTDGRRAPAPEPGRPQRDGTVLLWADGERVFGLVGPVDGTELLRMAESVR